MKICFIIQDFSLGGSSTVVYDLINNWNESDQIYLLCFFDDFNERYASILSKKNVEVIFLHKKRTVDFAFMGLFKKTINDIHPDVISCHLSSIAYLKLVYDIKKSCVFHTIHNRPKKDLPFIYRVLIKNDVKKGRIKLISCGESVKTESEKYYRVNVFNIQNGIDISDSIPFIEKQNEITTFLSIGRLTNVKSVDDIIKAFKIVQNSNTNCRLIICGYGPEENKLKELVNTYSLNEKVEFIGKTGDVKPLYLNSDVFCLFSEREGSPIVLMEAKKYGLTIIGSNVAGTRNLVDDGHNGFLVEYKDYTEAAKKMISLVENKELLLKMRRASLSDSKNYDLKTMVNSYNNLFIKSLEELK